MTRVIPPQPQPSQQPAQPRKIMNPTPIHILSAIALLLAIIALIFPNQYLLPVAVLLLAICNYIKPGGL